VSRRRGSRTVVHATLAVVGLLGALGLVVWRQGRAYEALSQLDETRREKGMLIAERSELDRRVQALESRARVVPDARRLLGMRTPESAEIVILESAS
jgi:cell division protein FtsL